jgi:hypothetical protein
MTNKKPMYAADEWKIPAGGYVQVNRTADFLSCLEADAAFRIQIGDAPETDFEKGLTFSAPDDFHKIRIINEGGEDISVKMAFGRGGIRDGRFTSLAAVETREKLILRPYNAGGLRTTGGVTVVNNYTYVLDEPVLLADADPMRQSIYLRNGHETTVVEVFSASEEGYMTRYPVFQIQPQETVNIKGGGALYAQSVGTGVAATVYMEELVHV